MLHSVVRKVSQAHWLSSQKYVSVFLLLSLKSLVLQIQGFKMTGATHHTLVLLHALTRPHTSLPPPSSFRLIPSQTPRVAL